MDACLKRFANDIALKLLFWQNKRLCSMNYKIKLFLVIDCNQFMYKGEFYIPISIVCIKMQPCNVSADYCLKVNNTLGTENFTKINLILIQPKFEF